MSRSSHDRQRDNECRNVYGGFLEHMRPSSSFRIVMPGSEALDIEHQISRKDHSRILDMIVFYQRHVLKNCDYKRTTTAIVIIMLTRASHAPARRDSQSSDLLPTCSPVVPTAGVPSLRPRTKPHGQLLSSVAATVPRSGFVWCGQIFEPVHVHTN